MNFFGFSKRATLRLFSLIELLIVVAIIGIVTSIVLVSATSGKNQKDVESAALFASARMREAQTAALTGQQQVASTTPCAYRVTWGSAQITNTYVYKDSGGTCGLVSTISTVSLPSGVLFTGSGSADFVLPHGTIATGQTITLQKGSVSRVICLQTNGRIEVQPTASSC